jgi:hypothetical protein
MDMVEGMRKAFLAVIFTMGFLVGFVCLLVISSFQSSQLNPYSKMSNDFKIIVVESETKNRTLYLDTSKWYCKMDMFEGGDATMPQDLYPPKAKIVFFFFEDIENSSLGDNWGDLIIRMNPIIDPISSKHVMVVVFYAEGGYQKLVYYRDELRYNYTYIPNRPDLTNSYGITTIDMVNDL